MRRHVAKTKRRQHSNKNKKSNIRNNKTKVVEKRRIVQRGGRTYQGLIDKIQRGDVNGVTTFIREEIYPTIYHHFIRLPDQSEIERRPGIINGNSALYTACSSSNPNFEMVNTLLYFGFKPDIQNKNPLGLFPQHGVVEAARAIISESGNPINKLQQLVLILKALKANGANMNNTNKNGRTAFEEYTTRPKYDAGREYPSIEEWIRTISPQISVEIRTFLNPVLYPLTAQGKQQTCHLEQLPYSTHYSTNESSDSKYGFEYNRVGYYFCSDISKLVQDERDNVSGDHSNYKTIVVSYGGIEYKFYIQLNKALSNVSFSIPGTCDINQAKLLYQQ